MTAAFTFAKATPEGRKLRASIQGPSGSGKTTSALRIAAGIVQREGGRVAVIDTEEGRSRLESHRFDFDLLVLSEPYSPESFVKAIAAAASHRVVIIDSATKEWEEILRQKDELPTKEQFTGWSKLNPKHDAFLRAVAKCPGHVIVTLRSKTRYEVQNVDGKARPVKLGMEPIARPQTEFEFDVALELDHESRCGMAKRPRGIFHILDDYSKREPGEELGNLISDALLGKLEGTEAMASAPPPPEVTEAELDGQLRALADLLTPARCLAVIGRSTRGMSLAEKRLAVEALRAAQDAALPPALSPANRTEPTLAELPAATASGAGPALPASEPPRTATVTEIWRAVKLVDLESDAVMTQIELMFPGTKGGISGLTAAQMGELLGWLNAIDVVREARRDPRASPKPIRGVSFVGDTAAKGAKSKQPITDPDDVSGPDDIRT